MGVKSGGIDRGKKEEEDRAMTKERESEVKKVDEIAFLG